MCHLGDFNVLANGLVATHRLIALDSRGHGKSTHGSQQLTYRFCRASAAGWDAKFPQTRKDYESLNPEADFERFVEASKQMWLDRSEAGYPGPDAVKALDQPVLIIRGDDDHLFSLAEAVELRTLIKQARLLNVPAAGHVVHQENEAICSTAIRQFLGV
jgi:pimeloyl-ACP methyl ester carboxylesterase